MLKFHPIQYFIISIIHSFVLAISHSYLCFFLSMVVTFCSIVLIKRNIKDIISYRFIIVSLSMNMGVFITSYLFGDSGIGDYYNATILASKMFCISVLSMFCLSHLPYEKLVIDFMKRKVINVKIGYALLSASRSVSIIKHNLVKIIYTARARKITFFLIIIPLVMSVMRQSQDQAISLYSRGLCNNKNFQQIFIRFGMADYAMVFLQVLFLIFCLLFLR